MPGTRSRSKKTVSPAKAAEAEARRAELLGKLSDGIDRLCDSAEWKRYLDVQSRFRRYSFANTMLILTQRPDATQVASFRKWLELDRCVVKGEAALRIWAPAGRAAKPEPEAAAEEKTEEAETATAKAYATRFVMVPVFDVSQTDGTPLPEPVRLLDGQDEAGIFGKLAKVAEGIGYRVQVTPEIDGHPGANGLCEYGHRKLTVAGNRSELQQVKSLAHEMGHALLHEPPADGKRDIMRGQMELEAESTAYVVCQSLGLDTSDYSFGYVAGWQSGDKDKAREQIKASGKRISGAARQICGELEAQPEAEPERAVLDVPAQRQPEPAALDVPAQRQPEPAEVDMEMA
ncbi:MAG TPA: ArdC-like ssDNA-binding domain-containing protein [Streptosporangiaceae bacterium]|nr:ArdC-like ssDNA-binding domain-containing protein [Streptosporangiaceae bacterium]